MVLVLRFLRIRAAATTTMITTNAAIAMYVVTGDAPDGGRAPGVVLAGVAVAGVEGDVVVGVWEAEGVAVIDGAGRAAAGVTRTLTSSLEA